MAGTGELGKADSLAGMAEGIGEFVERAAAEGASLREFEREVFDRLLKVGHAATEQFLAAQGDGDRGRRVVDDEGRTLYRSEQAAQRALRTIFGEHQFEAYVYRRGKHPHTPIVLRPVEEQLGIEPDRFSPLLQEFTMLLGIEQAFEAIFRQRLSVDTLERVSRRMGTQAGEFLDVLEPPPADEEGELLVQTADGKGVPMVRRDAQRLKSFEEKAKRPGNRRMATLAGVYSVDRFIRTPQQIVEALFRDEPEFAAERQPRPEPRHKRVCGYFQAHLGRMNYDEYLAAGYPIATGVIEGACRHLVKDRLERSGMRGTLAGAQAMLNLRALRQSSDWDTFQQQHLSPNSPHPSLVG